MAAASIVLRVALTGLLAAPALLVPRIADAFCGFYVAGGDAKLYNNATVVVLMRDGTRTVLSMQNNYQGPPQDFAMVVPVPVILKEQDVKTLPREIFTTVDALAAPRLVEYWEEDPCKPPVKYRKMASGGVRESAEMPVTEASGGSHGVKIEAQFTVGEYQILILSAKEATGLDTWLRENKYTIPQGAAEALRPYVQAGMKFFVAKVDTKKVTFDAQGQAMLSPLRFHYDSDTFNLPVRLGLLNSSGTQDLIVHVLAPQRYELANYPNATIPTNLEVKDAVRGNFGAFYVSLFDATMAQNPKAVITEYAWQANNCDPCPRDPLTASDLVTLGADVLPNIDAKQPDAEYSLPGRFVLTRLHARYAKDLLGEDLVFREAPAIGGGREVRRDGKSLEQGSMPEGSNNFQARYIIRHPWTGPVACANPVYGVWGGPPDGAAPKPAVAQNLAFADRSAGLAPFVAQDVPEIKFAVNMTPEATPPADAKAPDAKAPDAKADAKVDAKDVKQGAKPADTKASKGAGCGCTSDAGGAGWLAPLVLLGLRRRAGRKDRR